MGVGAGFCMYDVVVKKFTFAISSPDEFLLPLLDTATQIVQRPGSVHRYTRLHYCCSVQSHRQQTLKCVAFTSHEPLEIAAHLTHDRRNAVLECGCLAKSITNDSPLAAGGKDRYQPFHYYHPFASNSFFPIPSPSRPFFSFFLHFCLFLSSKRLRFRLGLLVSQQD